MPDKQTFWLGRDGEPSALVEGVAERDRWVNTHGYREVAEPGEVDQVHVVNDATGGRGALPYGPATHGIWAGLGWRVACPPEPVDLTKDSALFDPPPVEPAAAQPKTKPAASAASKEQ